MLHKGGLYTLFFFMPMVISNEMKDEEYKGFVITCLIIMFTVQIYVMFYELLEMLSTDLKTYLSDIENIIDMLGAAAFFTQFSLRMNDPAFPATPPLDMLGPHPHAILDCKLAERYQKHDKNWSTLMTILQFIQTIAAFARVSNCFYHYDTFAAQLLMISSCVSEMFAFTVFFGLWVSIFT